MALFLDTALGYSRVAGERRLGYDAGQLHDRILVLISWDKTLSHAEITHAEAR